MRPVKNTITGEPSQLSSVEDTSVKIEQVEGGTISMDP